MPLLHELVDAFLTLVSELFRHLHLLLQLLVDYRSKNPRSCKTASYCISFGACPYSLWYSERAASISALRCALRSSEAAHVAPGAFGPSKSVLCSGVTASRSASASRRSRSNNLPACICGAGRSPNVFVI